MQELNIKQTRFVEEFTVDFNASQAAVRAGYSEKSSRAIGCELLTIPNIKKAIQTRVKELSNDTLVNRELIISGLLAEATNYSDKSSHAARVSAWSQLAKVSGLNIENKPHDDVQQFLLDITERNAASRLEKGLLPKNHMDLDKFDTYGNRIKQ
tara:strand:- start:16849 stop:17310 length:462 start_codon:yes stop_codon:yes gene_type:complete